jgi:hypothetical protein
MTTVELLDSFEEQFAAVIGGSAAQAVRNAVISLHGPTPLAINALRAQAVKYGVNLDDRVPPGAATASSPGVASTGPAPEPPGPPSPVLVEPAPALAVRATAAPDQPAADQFDVERYYRHAKGGQIGMRIGQYVAVPRMLNYIALPPAGREVYRALCAVADNDTGLARVGYNRLAIETGMARSAVCRWVERLAGHFGLIRVVHRSFDRVTPNTYRVLFPKDWPDEYQGQLVAALTKIRAGHLAGGKIRDGPPGDHPTGVVAEEDVVTEENTGGD